MKIEFIKDHEHFKAKAGDVRDDIEEAAMLVGAGYAKQLDAEEVKPKEGKPAKATKAKNQVKADEVASEKAEVADEDQAKS
ncbi:hypothetical protein BWI93_19120 [Siphonobacter sp. BAB-5385]|uniref:hypothetical protein n=1 Tax=Siphonobacter sp. BAB-5385 TaxID=1864822 RepID=UPI000B9E479A|nr:hypothetical protein [Siphonobacter sp. BAB-5385]OZI06592.1 hypothetical protein BWI93_19120 [Siphonobacter sp. BAB-5385]